MSILFIDIETVPLYESYKDLPDQQKYHWDHKSQFLAKDLLPEDLYQRAGIYAEFGKVIVVSLAWMSEGDSPHLRVKTLSDQDERKLLVDLYDILVRIDNTQTLLCGHNIKEFDVPFLCRRMLIQQIPLPNLLDVSSKKPWQTPYVDTLEMWKFGDRKHYSKLDLLAHVFDLPTSKDDIDGSQVARVYYQDKDLERIATYCEKDVVLTSHLYRKMKLLPDLTEEQITYVDKVEVSDSR